MSLMPYLIAEAQHSADTGERMMRALPLAYPDDTACREYPYQYLFGRDLLIAPIVQPEAVTLSIYLPAGEWYDFWTGEKFTGGQVVQRPAHLALIPVYARAGASVPIYLP